MRWSGEIHLHRIRLCHEKAELAKDRDVIEKPGDGRRTEKLEDAEPAAKSWPT